MARTEVMKVRPVTDTRTDRAERTLDVDNGPVLEYARTYGPPTLIRWRPTRVMLRWERDVLRDIHLRGYRLRKDGSLGLVGDNATVNVKDGKVCAPRSRDWPIAWLQSIVDLYGQDMPQATLPPIDPDYRYSTRRCPPCAVGINDVVREADHGA